MLQFKMDSYARWFILLVITLMVPGAQAYSQTGDQGWPRTIHSNGIRIDVYQPQVDKWENGRLEDRTAVAITDKSTGESSYGTAWLAGRTTLDQEKRLVTLYDVEVSQVSFPAAGSKEAVYAKATKEALQQWTVNIALDRLLADIAITQNEQKSGGDEFSSNPPKIFVREKPAVLILIDGEPVLEKIPGSTFMRVVNTPAMIALDPASGRYFLRGDGYWVTATAINGTWSRAADAPAALSSLLASDEAANRPAGPAEGAPEIIVSTEPAELIQFKGEPQFSPIDGTRLLYITNTDSDVFLSLPQQHYFVLLSGRWFTAATLAGPWGFVAGSSLPVDFSRIPGGHPRSAVLASIPGTPEARDAVVAAQVPQTATVDRKKATFTASYDGEPKFKSIADTEMSYAVNSPDDVIHARGKYYAVSNGVWFVADDPRGPWAVADFVPPEIYSIPPTVPVYHVKYVHVYDSTPDYVYVGYTPGYFGSFIWDGVVVYGTGFYYPYWYGSYYLGWPWTWGFGFNYGYWGGGYYWRPWYPYPWYWHHWGHDRYPYHYWNRTLYNRSVAGRFPPGGVHGRSVYDRWRSPGAVTRHPVPLRSPGRIASRPETTPRVGPYRPGAPGRGTAGTGTFGAPRSGAPRAGAPGMGSPGARTPRSGAPTGAPRAGTPGMGSPGARTPRSGAQTGAPRAGTPGMGSPGARTPRSGAPGRDLYADRSGQIYSHQNNGWYRSDGRNWEKVQPRTTAPGAQQPRVQSPTMGGPTRSRIGELESSRQARIQGQYRVDQYRSMPPAARTTSPPPRISAPHYPSSSAPRASSPRFPSGSSPRMSAPRASGGSPHTSAPRSSGAPRGGSAPRSGGAPRGGGPRR